MFSKKRFAEAAVQVPKLLRKRLTAVASKPGG